MDVKPSEEDNETLTEDKTKFTKDSTSNLSDCQNSSETVTNDCSKSDNEIRMLANNLDKTLSDKSDTKNLPNGVTHGCDNDEIEYVSYKSELQMPDIMRLIQKDLSEPYSIYTYRYFIYNWPKLCFLVS